MRAPKSLALAILLVGCGSEPCADPAACDTDPVEGGAACTQLTDGTWTADGQAFGMPMTATLTAADDCTFTLTAWNMTMGGDLPYAGGVDGETVTLDGPGTFWPSCVGTAIGPAAISGSCEEGDTPFELTLAD